MEYLFAMFTVSLVTGTRAKSTNPITMSDVGDPTGSFRMTVEGFLTRPATSTSHQVINTVKVPDRESFMTRSGVSNESNINTNEVPKAALITLTTLNTMLALSSVALNSGIVWFYRASTTTTSGLYQANGVADMCCGVGVLLHCPVIVCLIHQQFKRVLVPFIMAYIITSVSFRMSAFLNCLLGLVRCIKIVSRHTHIYQRAISLISSLYCLLWTGISIADVYMVHREIGFETKRMEYLIKRCILDPMPGQSLYSLLPTQSRKFTSLSALEGFTLSYGVPLILPSLLCLLLASIQIYYLVAPSLGSGELGDSAAARSSAKLGDSAAARSSAELRQRSSVTILLVTVVFVVTSLATLTVALGVSGSHLSVADTVKRYSWTELILMYSATSTFQLLCSSLTPIVLMLRVQGLKRALLPTNLTSSS